MGNRAVIVTEKNFTNNGVGVYIHWNGGRDSVEGFLKYCELRGFRSPDTDCYGYARLIQVIANFFGADGLSVGVDTIDHLDCDNGDNGVYIIKGWEIVDRQYFDWKEQTEYELNDMLHAIDEAQPKEQQLGDFLSAKEVDLKDVKIGDTVYVRVVGGSYKGVKVLDFGDGRIVNGLNTKNLPYAEIVGEPLGKDNPNNYITSKTVRRKSV
jgi:hypothetical protein